jgi:hypothetical protein
VFDEGRSTFSKSNIRQGLHLAEGRYDDETTATNTVQASRFSDNLHIFLLGKVEESRKQKRLTKQATTKQAQQSRPLQTSTVIAPPPVRSTQRNADTMFVFRYSTFTNVTLLDALAIPTRQIRQGLHLAEVRYDDERTTTKHHVVPTTTISIPMSCTQNTAADGEGEEEAEETDEASGQTTKI